MKDHSRVYLGCSAGVVSACVGIGRYSLISDTEPEALQNSLASVSAVEFQGNTLVTADTDHFKQAFSLQFTDLFQSLAQNILYITSAPLSCHRNEGVGETLHLPKEKKASRVICSCFFLL